MARQRLAGGPGRLHLLGGVPAGDRLLMEEDLPVLTDKTIVKVALTTGVALLVLAAAGFIAVQLAGEHVDADGVLHEPFLLKVATACALVVGAVLTGVSLLVRRR